MSDPSFEYSVATLIVLLMVFWYTCKCIGSKEKNNTACLRPHLQLQRQPRQPRQNQRRNPADSDSDDEEFPSGQAVPRRSVRERYAGACRRPTSERYSNIGQAESSLLYGDVPIRIGSSTGSPIIWTVDGVLEVPNSKSAMSKLYDVDRTQCYKIIDPSI